ncbi:MAG: hypothetical protein IPL08_09790 [Saprospiraceae bacterium]|nr:hypothetical protein [Saprospiraceae bacterium]
MIRKLHAGFSLMGIGDMDHTPARLVVPEGYGCDRLQSNFLNPRNRFFGLYLWKEIQTTTSPLPGIEPA